MQNVYDHSYAWIDDDNFKFSKRFLKYISAIPNINGIVAVKRNWYYINIALGLLVV